MKLLISQPDLSANELNLRQKIMLLCLMEVRDFFKTHHYIILTYKNSKGEIVNSVCGRGYLKIAGH